MLLNHIYGIALHVSQLCMNVFKVCIQPFLPSITSSKFIHVDTYSSSAFTLTGSSGPLCECLTMVLPVLPFQTFRYFHFFFHFYNINAVNILVHVSLYTNVRVFLSVCIRMRFLGFRACSSPVFNDSFSTQNPNAIESVVAIYVQHPKLSYQQSHLLFL